MWPDDVGAVGLMGPGTAEALTAAEAALARDLQAARPKIPFEAGTRQYRRLRLAAGLLNAAAAVICGCEKCAILEGDGARRLASIRDEDWVDFVEAMEAQG